VTHRARVLVVDDEPDFRSSLAMLLTFEGFHVTGAADGHEALRLAASGSAGPHDVILIDYRMPGLHGGEVAHRLRALGVHACLILVSAVADLSGIAAQYSFDDAVKKPCDIAELTRAIRRCVSSGRGGCADAFPS
jgi:two-component system response regulator RegX3